MLDCSIGAEVTDERDPQVSCWKRIKILVLIYPGQDSNLDLKVSGSKGQTSALLVRIVSRGGRAAR
jgi:hypothetical protein